MAVFSPNNASEKEIRMELGSRIGSTFEAKPGVETTRIATERRACKKKWGTKLNSVAKTVLHHVKTHMGVGMVCAVAYFDPGNWGVDLKAGSEYGYRLLFVVLLAGLFAVFFQVLASRLGCVTGLDLASHCRLLLNHSPRSRWLGLYPLYAFSEIAIIATDLAELLGSAIALCLLFPKLELWHGVLITAFDVLVLLAFGDPLRGTPVRWFEWVISGLVLAVLVCMCVILTRVNVDWGDAFEGFLPSKHIFPGGALYTSVGILGATIMPHSLFLGSALATQDRVQADGAVPHTPLSIASLYPSNWFSFPRLRESLSQALQKPPRKLSGTFAKRHSERVNRPLEFVKAHLYHGIVDVALSLLGFAVVINSSILIISSAVFFTGDFDTENSDPAGLFDAYDLIQSTVGQGAATLFAVALLAAGQSASIVATVAGQAVSEGFLEWRTSPILRRLITRLISLVPSVTVAVVMGRSGIDVLLIASQVVLAVVLPFVTLPLLWLTSKKEVMHARPNVLEERREEGEGEVLEEKDERVAMEREETLEEELSVASSVTAPVQDRDMKDSQETEAGARQDRDEEEETDLAVDIVCYEERLPHAPPELPIQPTSASRDENQIESQLTNPNSPVYFNNGPLTMLVGCAIWLILVCANGFVIVTLAMGKGDDDD
ncbi:Manganese transporter smf1 [Marasmius crinis-equi]|uniref:Manganese transporter smf1 n=1 Tax=Marasmius crinis-equi TaxID=585013 RepID=A0ABR3FET6_9AGAR